MKQDFLSQRLACGSMVLSYCVRSYAIALFHISKPHFCLRQQGTAEGSVRQLSKFYVYLFCPVGQKTIYRGLKCLASESPIRGQSAPQDCRFTDDQFSGEIGQCSRPLLQQIQSGQRGRAAHVEDRLAHRGQRRCGIGRTEQIVEAH
jgi:hypothetical protein